MALAADGLALIFEQPKKTNTKPQKFKAKVEFMDSEGEVNFQNFVFFILVHIHIYSYDLDFFQGLLQVCRHAHR